MQFLQRLGCKSSPDGSNHTNDVTAYTFDGESAVHDELLLLDFPGYDDADDRIATACVITSSGPHGMGDL